jgi:catechol 2,3-dioxygenase-like lactoylglutathione lyase family enzyme
MKTLNDSKTFGLTHLAVGVRDVKRTGKFYHEVFAMETMYDQDNFIQMTTPGCNDILVFEQKEDICIGTSGGIAHFGFRLKNADDIEEIVAKVKVAGGEIIDQGEFVQGSPYVFFKDPDGYVVEVWYEVLT